MATTKIPRSSRLRFDIFNQTGEIFLELTELPAIKLGNSVCGPGGVLSLPEDVSLPVCRDIGSSCSDDLPEVFSDGIPVHIRATIFGTLQ